MAIVCYNHDNMKRNIVLTVGVTAHAEGVLAHKTMQAIFASLANLDDKKYPYEIIVHIDNGDEETINYFKRYKNDKRFKIIHSNFRDLGMSRNCIVKNASGKYISFLDADDMLSSNWYTSALKRMEKSKEVIMVHPNIQFNFGAGTRLEFTERKDSFEKAEDAIISAGVNRWCSAIMGERETFLKYPYMETKNGYGYEDYNLNTNTLGHGIKHMIAPKTVMFYRQKAEGSLLASSNVERVIQPYVSLLDVDFIKSIPEETIEKMRPRIIESKRRGRMLRIYYAARENKYTEFFILPVAKLAKKILGIRPVAEQKGGAKIPDFMLREWKKINKIDSQLYPTKEALSEIFQAKADDYDVGLAYYDIVKNIPELPDYLFIVPWVRVGGADKVLINYIKAIKHHHPEWKVAVMTTLPGKNIRSDELPDNAYLIDFGNRAKTIWPTQKDLLFSRLITQLRCKKIHIINSEYGYNWAMSHKKFMKSERELSVSIFSMTNKYNPGIGSYANPYLLNIYSVVKNIYSDNENMLKDLIETQGFEQKNMYVIHQPIDLPLKDKDRRNDDKKKRYRVLWASRVDDEKMPKLVPDIMKQLDTEKYVIEMWGEMSDAYKVDMFNQTAGLVYKGKFKNFDELCERDYDAFLYTSNRDGMPNVLLEAASHQIPIVASNIGGISEFIRDKETGLLVNDIENCEEYAKNIRNICEKPKQAKQYTENAKKLLKREHSWEQFYDATKKMFE